MLTAEGPGSGWETKITQAAWHCWKKKLFKENTQDSLQIFLPASSQLYVLTDMLVVDEPITNQPPCAGTPSLRGVGAQHPEVP